MADVKALSILSTQIENYRNIHEPPRNLDDVAKYSKNIRQVLDGAQIELSRVVTYIEQVEKKIQELKDAQSASIKNNQDAIQKLFATVKPAAHPTITDAPKTRPSASDAPKTRPGASDAPKTRPSASDAPKIRPSVSDARKSALEKIQLAHEMEKISQEMMKDKLNDLLKKTDIACAKLKDNTDFCYDDIEQLQGCLTGWKDAKEESDKAEDRKRKEQQQIREEQKRRIEELERKELERKKREEVEKEKKEKEERKREREEAERKAEEERRRKEENERKKQEEIQRKKQEQAERKKKQEEERKRRLKDEAERKADEKKRQKEEAEEEKRRREELQRMRREEAERKKKEEIINKEEEERLRKQEEDEIRRKTEMEMIRREEEANIRETERLQKEAEERARMQDTSNWKPITYVRENDEVGGKGAFRGDVNFVMISPPGGIEKGDLECCVSDEVDSIIEIIENDEKPISSIIDIQSKKGRIHTEVPSTIYIPYFPVLNAGDETIVKLSLDGNEWVTITPEQTTTNMSEQEKTAKRMAGVKVNDFSSLKAIVVTRPRCQTIVVDKPGLTVRSSMDKNLKLTLPKDAFPSKTELKLVVQAVSEETSNKLAKENSTLDNVLSVKMITLTCARRSEKSIEIDLQKSSQKQGVFHRGESYQLYASRERQWKFADVEFKSNNEDLTVTLPAGRKRYTIMELDMPSGFPKENVASIAETLYTCMDTTVVRMIVRQHGDDLKKCAIRIVKRELSRDTLAYLSENGYSEGPGESAEFILKEGQHVQIHCTGNIEDASELDRGTKLSYLSYMGGVMSEMTLRVKDSWKQQDLPAYIGSVRCIVLRDDDSTEPSSTRSIDLTISLPKLSRPRTTRATFPYYLRSLAIYLSRNVCADGTNNWKAVLRSVLGNTEFSTRYRIAKRKFVEGTEESVCEAMLLDWMKRQAVQDDKLSPIKVALINNGRGDIAKSCSEFVKIQKDNLSDAILSDIAENITKDVYALGQALGITSEKITNCVKQHPDNVKEQYVAILFEWRESEDVIKHGEDVLQYLKKTCV